jgi:hypothetical protein
VAFVREDVDKPAGTRKTTDEFFNRRDRHPALLRLSGRFGRKTLAPFAVAGYSVNAAFHASQGGGRARTGPARAHLDDCEGQRIKTLTKATAAPKHSFVAASYV